MLHAIPYSVPFDPWNYGRTGGMRKGFSPLQAACYTA
jgi:hypothetical protein